MTCPDDVWDEWAIEPACVDPEDELDLIGPHAWHHRAWRPVETLPDIGTYRA